MKLVHIQTQVQTVFGVLDDDGNVIPQQPITANVGLFKPVAFVEAHAAIAQARDQALAASEAIELAASSNGGTPASDRATRRASARKTTKGAKS